MPKHGRVQSTRPCRSTLCTAVDALCTRPMHAGAHGPSVSRTRPCTQPVRGKTRPDTRPVPDRVRTVYMAVHGRLHGRLYGPCARLCTYHVHGRAWSVHDPNAAAAPTRPCLEPVPCTRPFTACTDRVHHDTVHSGHRKG